MAEVVYVLCAVTSVLCTYLLIRGYRQTETRLLLWVSLCFAGLAINNLLLFVDLVVAPEWDLSISRNLTGIAGCGLFLFGVLWDRAH